MLNKFTSTVVPNVSPLQGNSIENDERVSFGLIAGTTVGNLVNAVDWSDSIFERCRFQNTQISNSGFERVAFIDCHLSSVSFSNCLLRECLFLGVTAKYHLAFDNCILDRVMMARSRVDNVDIHHSRIVEIEFLGMESAQIEFHQCEVHRRKGRVSFEDCDVRKIVGIEAMGKQGVSVDVDASMWRDLGDYYLKERGIQQVSCSTSTRYNSLDEIANSRQQCATVFEFGGLSRSSFALESVAALLWNTQMGLR